MDRVAADTADRKAVAIAEAADAARRKEAATAVAEATARHRAEAVRAVDRPADRVAEAVRRHQAAAIPQDITVVEFDCASFFLAPVGGRHSLPIHRQEASLEASCTP